MIHRLSSSLTSFKTLTLKLGLNVLVAKKEEGASEKQTRNRAGKSSVIEIVHFLMGSDAGKDSLFRSEALVNESFGIEFDLGGERLYVARSGLQKSKIHDCRSSRAGSHPCLPGPPGSTPRKLSRCTGDGPSLRKASRWTAVP